MTSGYTSSTRPSALHPAIDYRIIVAASLLLSAWLILIDSIINRDAILYLRTAQAYLQDGVLASFALFDRPFLPIVMGMLHQLTGISLLTVGLLLTTLFYAFLSVAFVSIVRLLGGDRRIQIIAAIIILSHPLLAQSRDSIMRDPPFWAFSLLAFRSLLLYTQDPRFKHQVHWFIFIAIASVFRFEGLFFALLAPFAVFSASVRTDRLRISLRLLALPLLSVFILAGIILLFQNILLPGSHLFSDIGGYIDKLLAFPEAFSDLSLATGEALLVFTAKEDAGFAALAGIAAILLVNLFRALMLPYVIVLVWGWKKKLTSGIPTQSRRLLNGHLLIALVYLGLFTLTNRFMLERYCHIFTIFVALYLPFILNTAFAADKKPLIKILAILLMLGMSIDAVVNGNYKKMFIKDATEWVVINTPASASITSNSGYIAYFSERAVDWSDPGKTNFTVQDLTSRPLFWRKNDYLIILIKHREEALWKQFLQQNALTELRTFQEESRGKVSIVQIPPSLRIYPQERPVTILNKGSNLN